MYPNKIIVGIPKQPHWNAKFNSLIKKFYKERKRDRHKIEEIRRKEIYQKFTDRQDERTKKSERRMQKVEQQNRGCNMESLSEVVWLDKSCERKSDRIQSTKRKTTNF